MSGALSEVPGTIRRHLIAHHSPLIKAIVAVPLLARVRNRCRAQMQPPAPRRGCSPSPSSPPSGGKQLPACVCTPAASVPGPAGNPCPPPVSLTQPCLQVRLKPTTSPLLSSALQKRRKKNLRWVPWDQNGPFQNEFAAVPS